MFMPLKHAIPLAAILLLAACGESPPETDTRTSAETSSIADDDRLLPAGAWRGVIEIQGKQLPFQAEVTYASGDATPHVEFINGEERVPVDEVHIAKNEVALVMTAFNTRIDGRFRDGKLSGTLTKINEGAERQQMPVTLTPGEHHRFFPM